MLARTLTFRKCFTQTTQHQCKWWALTGHFDELECSELKTMTLADIQRYNLEIVEKSSRNTYCYAIFLICDDCQNDMSKDEQYFWNNRENQFISITKIHFPETINLKKQFDGIVQYFTALASNKEYSQILWRTYYTIELSDMVLVSKSTSMNALSRWSLLATKTNLVGSAYTYFGIPGYLIDGNVDFLPDTLKKDTIDFLSIRFSIQNGNIDATIQNGNIDAILTQIRKSLGEQYTTPAFRVTGNEDIIISGQDIPTVNLIRLYQKWYSDKGRILNTFHDIITRLGVNWNIDPQSITTSTYQRQETTLEKYSIAVLDKIHPQIFQFMDIDKALWLRPLVTLTNALVHMSQSAPLDETVFLILPGLEAFWNNIPKDGQQIAGELLFHRFAELCIHTMEHLMRAEGQLSHRLEMRPLTYDMPVFVLEYATAFLLFLSKTLTIGDGDKPQKIAFLLVPSASTAVFTEELFSSTNETPGLIQITVPFSLLYTPKLLLPSLCHEMAHYVGEKIRLRERRYNLFLQSVSHELIRFFFDHVSGNIEKFQEFLITEILDGPLIKYFEENKTDIPIKITEVSLSEIVFAINRNLKTIFSEESSRSYIELFRSYIRSSYRGAQLYSIPLLALNDRFDRFSNRLDDIMVYYRESYADLCMLFLLKMSAYEYITVSVRQWINLTDGMLFQVYACLSVSGHSLTEIKDAITIFAKAENVDGATQNEKIDTLVSLHQWVSLDSAEKHVLEYLKACWDCFQRERFGELKVYKHYTVKEIYDCLLSIDSQDSRTTYSDILDIIDNGRQEILNHFSSISK